MEALLERGAVAHEEELTAGLVGHLVEEIRVDGVVGGAEDRAAKQAGALLHGRVVAHTHQDGIDLHAHRARELRRLGGRNVAGVGFAVGQQDDHFALRPRTLEPIQADADRVADGRASAVDLVELQPAERVSKGLPIGGEGQQGIRVAAEDDGADTIVRSAVDEIAHDRFRRSEPSGPDVRSLHRSGHVERQDDLDAADLRGVARVDALGTRQTDHEQRECNRSKRVRKLRRASTPRALRRLEARSLAEL